MAEYDSDTSAVLAEVQAKSGKEEISDGCARTIASWYHDGGVSDTYAFVSSGAIVADSLWRQFTNNGTLYDSADADDKLALDALGTYLLNRENKGPVPGWSELWIR